ncbi:hypothetical protein QR680_018587 [Steinernema hermaphroditum]|uniref:Uncharacterized protein n=1 Tax=Steinernema hermaphroditum TaxID=289476 RepID=A0AA39HIF5_9BILA|nr:hypothetical protein QR680_018587 [Steinernema hermaphroditum]
MYMKGPICDSHLGQFQGERTIQGKRIILSQSSQKAIVVLDPWAGPILVREVLSAHRIRMLGQDLFLTDHRSGNMQRVKWTRTKRSNKTAET